MAHPISPELYFGVSYAGAPISNGYRPPGYYVQRFWHRQAKPYTIRLPYHSISKWSTVRASWDNSSYIPLDGIYSSENPYLNALAKNKAYDKFRAETGEYTQWANNLIEARKSVAMIANRVGQIVKFARALRKGNLKQAYDALSISVKQRPRSERGWRKPKSFSDGFLEVHFGWEPLVKDIYGGLEALSRDFGPVSVKGSGSAYGNTRSVVHTPGREGDTTSMSWLRQVGCTMRGDVRIINPNLALASDVGLINPLSIAWEAVPFSFVVDWFTNVGQILASASDFVGLEITNGSTTFFTRNEYVTSFSGTRFAIVSPPGGDSYERPYPVYSTHGVNSVFTTRHTSILGPELVLKPFKGFSVLRGSTAIALLVQLLKVP